MFDLSSLGIADGTLLMFAMLFGMLLLGMPLAFVTLFVALFFAVGWFGPMAVPLITERVYSFVTSYVFVSVPMFVLMAAILDRSGIARDLFDAMKLIAGGLRGGVAIQTIFVAVILAAMSGIVGGEIVLLGLLALPQMLRLGYNRNLAIGVVCAGGSLGTMVPPSIVLIVYGLTANVSIGDLFTAAFIPGFMLAGFYVLYVLIRAYLNPSIAPVLGKNEMPWRERFRLLKRPDPAGAGHHLRARLDLWRHSLGDRGLGGRRRRRGRCRRRSAASCPGSCCAARPSRRWPPAA